MEEKELDQFDKAEIKRKQVSRSRIFFLLVVVTLAILAYFIYEIVMIVS